MRGILVLIASMVISVVPFPISAQAVEARMSVTDREILERFHSLDVGIARLQEGQRGLQRQIGGLDKSIDGLDKRIDGLDKRIDGLDKRIDRVDKSIDGLTNLMLGGFGVVFAGIFSLIGFVIWDRRTAVSPVISKTRELEEKGDLAFKVFKEYAGKEPKLAEVLRSLGLL